MSTKAIFGEVPVFRPTLDEFKDFSGYVSKIWEQGEKSGLVKVIPPQGWSPTQRPYNTQETVIPVPIKQVINGRQGKFGMCRATKANR